MAFLPKLPTGEYLPDRVLVFYIRLPIPLPLSERAFIWEPPGAFDPTARTDPSPRWLSLRFKQFEADPPSLIPPNYHRELDELLGEPSIDHPAPRATGNFLHTWCVGVAATDGDLADPSVVFMAFNACFHYVNRIIRAYVARTGNFRIRPIALEEIHTLVLWELRNVRDLTLAGRGTLIVNQNIPVAPEPVSLELERTIATTVVISEPSREHPFTVYREWLERAKHARLQEGDREGAIVFLQTATESWLRELFRMTLVDANLTTPDIDAQVARYESFKALLQTGLPTRLGGRWDLSLSSTPVGRYWTDLYQLRNRIVHGASYVTHEQVRLGFDAYAGLIAELNRLLINHSARFRRTMLALLGEPGLRKRALWSRPFEETKREIAAEANPFWWPVDRR